MAAPTLLILVLINLMSNYKYQHSFFSIPTAAGPYSFTGNDQSAQFKPDRALAAGADIPPSRLGLLCALVITATVVSSKSKYIRLYGRYHEAGGPGPGT